MMTGNDEIIVALYDYSAQEFEELSIRKNEQLILIDDKFSWWKVRNASGKIGLVPSNFLRRDKAKGESLVNKIANKFPGNKKGGRGASNGPGFAGGGGAGMMFPSAGPASTAANPLNELHVSKFNFDATKGDELSLTKGMRVLVLEMEGDGWWFGKNADRPGNPGWFPSNYVTKETQSVPSAVPPPNILPATAASKRPSDGLIMVVRSLYPFNSGNDEELPFEQDELLDIIEEPANDPEWYLARNAEGATGLVPKNYVERVAGTQSVSKPSYDPVLPGRARAAPHQANVNGFLPTPNSSIPSTQSQQGSITEREWYFGALRRTDAERMLTERARNGEFLVRDSERAAGYSISVKATGRPRHFKINVLPDGQYGIGQRTFASMDILVAHYKQSPIFTSPEQGKLFLTNPVPR